MALPTTSMASVEGRRMRLVVLFGGRSAEHDVSCVSARHVLAAADTAKYSVEPVGITRQGVWVQAVEASEALRSDPANLPVSLTAAGPAVDPLRFLTGTASVEHCQDTVVIPVLHGPMGEDGTIQGLLDLTDVPYAGAGVLASALCMDKTMTKTILAAVGIAHARWTAVRVDGSDAAEHPGTPPTTHAIEHLGLPVFVKPANMGSSVGISKAHTAAEATAAIYLAANYDRTVIVEESVRGREIEVALLGNDDPIASVPGEIVPGSDFYSYDDKYSDGAELLIPAPLSPDEVAEAQSLAIDAYRALRVEGIARVDFFYEDGRHGRGNRGWLVNEVNTMPGFTPISMYPKLWHESGIGYSDLIDRLVHLALERHARRRRHMRTDR